jgi:hypothetical protein
VLGQSSVTTEEDRIDLPGLLLEHVGFDAAIRLGDPKVSKDAIDDLT